MRETSSPSQFFAEHGHDLAFMAFVALVLRPVLSALTDLTKQQAILGPVSVLVRWLDALLRAAPEPGLLPERLCRARRQQASCRSAPALRDVAVQRVRRLVWVAVQWVGAFLLFFEADWRLIIPLAIWLAGYAVTLNYFVPQIEKRSGVMSEARSMLIGRIVDSYTNILTVKLFAHAEREDQLRARGARRADRQLPGLAAPQHHHGGGALHAERAVLMSAPRGSPCGCGAAARSSIGAISVVTGLVMRIIDMSGWFMWTLAGIFENIGVVQEGMKTIARPVHGRRCRGRTSRSSCAWRDPLRRRELRLRAHAQARRRQPGGIIQNLSLHVGAGREGRPRRPLGRRQVDARQPAAALLRPGAAAAS